MIEQRVRLQQGGQSFRVRHRELGTLHVLRVIAGDADVERRLRQEARAQARIEHPNLCTITDVVRHDSNLCLVSAYVPGDTLDVHLQREGRLSVQAALQLMAPILSAMAAAHDAGRFHGDITPASIVLEPIGEQLHPRVVDFGLVGLVPGASRSGTGQQPSQRADVAALGATLQRLLGDSLNIAAPPLPESLVDALDLALSTEPDEQRVGVRQFARTLFRDSPDLLQSVNDGSPVRRPVVGTREHVASPSTARSMTSLAIAAAIAVGAVGLLWLWMAKNPAISEGPVYEPVTDVVAPVLPPVPSDSDSDS